MDRQAWSAAIHGVAKSRTRLSDWTELNWTSWPRDWTQVSRIVGRRFTVWATRESALVRNSFSSVQFSSLQSLSCVWLLVTPWIAALQDSLSITNSRSSLKLTSIKSVMPSSQLILCHPLFLLPPIPLSIRVFSNESTLCMRWPKYWSFSFSIIPSKEHARLISFTMEGHLGCCQVLAIMNKVSVNIHVQVLCDHKF